jgi:hypothetical protein
MVTVLYAVDSNARHANKEMDENLRKFLEGRQIPEDIVEKLENEKVSFLSIVIKCIMR